MKKFLMVLGFVTLVLIIFIAGFVGYSAIKGRQLDASSKAYVDANIPTIISSWSEVEVLKRASTELQEDLKGQQWNPFYSKVKKLGNFLSYEGCEGQSYTSISPQYG